MASSGLSKRILIVDDDAIMADMLSNLLEACGHTVFTAHDGTAAVKIARETCPDVVVTDIDLPDIDGYELARQLRQHPDTRPVTLAALTGFGRGTDKRKALDAGFDRHFCKPVSVEEIVAFINQPSAAASVAAPPAASTPATPPAPPA